MHNPAQAVRSAPPSGYAGICLADAADLAVRNDLTIPRALEILRERLHKPGAAMASAQAVRDHL